MKAAYIAGRRAIWAAFIGAAATIIGTLFGQLDDDSDPPPAAATVVNCTVEQQNVISLIEKNPGWQFAYSGPAEEQCHLNDLVKSAPKPTTGS